MVYINLVFIIASSLTAGWCFSVDMIATGVFNLFAVVLNVIAVTLHLESNP